MPSAGGAAGGAVVDSAALDAFAAEGDRCRRRARLHRQVRAEPAGRHRSGRRRSRRTRTPPWWPPSKPSSAPTGRSRSSRASTSARPSCSTTVGHPHARTCPAPTTTTTPPHWTAASSAWARPSPMKPHGMRARPLTPSLPPRSSAWPTRRSSRRTIRAEASRFAGDIAVVTGVAPNSIAAQVVNGLLAGGATVVATSHSFRQSVKAWAKQTYREHAGRRRQAVACSGEPVQLP